jgi:hypothetical protein
VGRELVNHAAANEQQFECTTPLSAAEGSYKHKLDRAQS